MITMTRRIFYMLLGGMMALALVGAAIGGGTAVFAQEDETPAPPTTEEAVPTLPGRGLNGEQRPNFDGLQGQRSRPGGLNDDSYLADALGISVEELDAAKEAVRAAQLEEAVTQALADGLITEEQAEAILSGEASGRGMRGFGLDKRGDQGAGDEQLAAELGITIEELEAAKDAARDAAQAQALEDGIITQEQVDLMEAGRALREYVDQDAVLANLLGLSVEELAAAKEDRAIRDLIETSGLTQEEIQTAMQEAHDAAVAQAVADGVITQEQADQLQEAPGCGSDGPRGGHGRGGFDGPRGGTLPNGTDGQTTPNSPNTNTTNTNDA